MNLWWVLLIPTILSDDVSSFGMSNPNKQQLEGVGISPDIEVNFDMSLFESNGRDTQLERALQFIRSGE